MSARNPAHCQDALRWLRNRKWDLAPLTGQDVATLLAISHCWELWTRGDDTGRRAAIEAVAALLTGCQEVVWPMARELIAQSGDWGHRDEVWPRVVERFDWITGVDGVSRARVTRLARCHHGLAQVNES